MASLGPRVGGNQSALALTESVLLASGSGTFYSANVTRFGSATGGFYDAASIAAAGPSNLIAGVFGLGPVAAGPFSFFNGLVFLAGQGMTASVAFSKGP